MPLFAKITHHLCVMTLTKTISLHWNLMRLWEDKIPSLCLHICQRSNLDELLGYETLDARLYQELSPWRSVTSWHIAFNESSVQTQVKGKIIIFMQKLCIKSSIVYCRQTDGHQSDYNHIKHAFMSQAYTRQILNIITKYRLIFNLKNTKKQWKVSRKKSKYSTYYLYQGWTVISVEYSHF